MSAAKLRKDDVGVFVIDLIMTIILVVNLLWFAFEFFWENQSIRNFFQYNVPAFYDFYVPIHADFAKYDLWFVIIFLTEFLTRWTIAVVKGTYHRWFYYPVIHFYDVLGLIPAGYFRILRVLRLFSIMYRLQRMGVINVKQWYVYQKLMFVKNIFVEEISDRVVIRLLTNIQEGVVRETDKDPSNNLIYVAVYPHRQEIVDWLANKVRSTATREYMPKREEVEAQIEELVKKVLSGSAPMQALEKIPIIGKPAANRLEASISEGIFEGIDGLMQQLADEENTKIEEVSGKVFDALINTKEGDEELNRIIKTIVVNVLEEMKRKTAIKEWQQKSKKTSPASY